MPQVLTALPPGESSPPLLSANRFFFRRSTSSPIEESTNLPRRHTTIPHSALVPAPLALVDEVTIENHIVVDSAGDARANGVYIRSGKQNNAPRWRHSERNWLCILRDGSNWWIGCERAAIEDLYWRDATKPNSYWRVCPCDDNTHRHFRGSGPAPSLYWICDNEHSQRDQEENQNKYTVWTTTFSATTTTNKSDSTSLPLDENQAPTKIIRSNKILRSPPSFESDVCPICLSDLDECAARTPCGHFACAECLARTRRMTRTNINQRTEPFREMRCPLCRAPFILAAASHVNTGKPLLEAFPALDTGDRESKLRAGTATSTSSSNLLEAAGEFVNASSSSISTASSRLAGLWFLLSSRTRSSSAAQQQEPTPSLLTGTANSPTIQDDAIIETSANHVSMTDYLVSRRSL
eukprot:CAMPEP_0197288356 /NCGR_PEP_ID=MMETSP0890-20130614/5393_1 /TAXON_ID=44058 ORGANISM="Aureoumbra lagunensis, Strain CCMP1510" /NCGR_SAMPLE_ID=MMETSP0890 /ASSEMBLY_ACC=CAM_ASM_000533 /LENGTH=408 /DNA_ID=CAMNT_0042759013 /DNA_START=70 /DNA_END=1296 /DNA_ORIENTATION=+